MKLLLLLLSVLIPTAHAGLEDVGASNSGVANMWSVICSSLPFCGTGVDASNAPAFFSARIILIVQSLITAAAIIMIIWASVKISTAQGDDSKIEEGKKIVLYAVAGLIIAIVGGTFVTYMLNVVYQQLFV